MEIRVRQEPVRPTTSKVQIANDEDCMDDLTEHWPAERPRLSTGVLAETRFVPEGDIAVGRIIDPVLRVEGIEPSAEALVNSRSRRKRASASSIY